MQLSVAARLHTCHSDQLPYPHCAYRYLSTYVRYYFLEESRLQQQEEEKKKRKMVMMMKEKMAHLYKTVITYHQLSHLNYIDMPLRVSTTSGHPHAVQ
jgi:hypothetical protein